MVSFFFLAFPLFNVVFCMEHLTWSLAYTMTGIIFSEEPITKGSVVVPTMVQIPFLAILM